MKYIIIVLLMFLPAIGQQYSLSFDGGDYLVHDINNYRGSDNAGAVAIWVRFDNLGSIERVFCTSDVEGTSNWIMFRKNSNNTLNFIANLSGTTKNYSTTETVGSATWMLIVWQSNGSATQIYKDNVALTITGAGEWFNDVAAIGANDRDNISVGHLIYSAGPLAGFTGDIAEIHVFNDVLTPAELTILYNSGKIYDDHSPITSMSKHVDTWLFNDGSGTTTTNTASNKEFIFGDGATPTTYPTWSSDTPDISLTPSTATPERKYRINPNWRGFKP